MGFIINVRHWIAIGVLACAGAGALWGCANGAGTSDQLTADEVRSAMRQMPWLYRLRSVEPPADSRVAFRGRGHGKGGAVLNFSIVLGDSPRPIPIPNTGLQDETGYSEAGFIYNSDSVDRRKFKTTAERHEAQDMSVEIEEALCEEATGQPCPV